MSTKFLTINVPLYPNELWLPVPEFESYYAVSNYGRVYSLRYNKFLKPGVNQTGYHHVNLRVNYTHNSKRVHRLVALAFIPIIEGKTLVNHIDGVKLNNHVSNLEWVTNKENSEHASKTGLLDNTKPAIRLSDTDRADICARYVKGCRVNGTVAIARDYGVTHVAILSILKRHGIDTTQ